MELERELEKLEECFPIGVRAAFGQPGYLEIYCRACLNTIFVINPNNPPDWGAVWAAVEEHFRQFGCV